MLSTMSPRSFENLICPETHQRVAIAPAALIDQLNAQIVLGLIRSRSQRVLKATLETGLLRQDGKVIYPVIQGVAQMLIDEGIEMAQAGCKDMDSEK